MLIYEDTEYVQQILQDIGMTVCKRSYNTSTDDSYTEDRLRRSIGRRSTFAIPTRSGKASMGQFQYDLIVLLPLKNLGETLTNQQCFHSDDSSIICDTSKGHYKALL